MKNSLLVTFAFCCCVISSSVAQSPWPGEAWTSSINLTSLDADFNTNMSGQFWNPLKRDLWVVSNSGIFWKLKEGGPLGFMIDVTGGTAKWNAGGDLEDVTMADLNDNSVFIMNETGYIEEHSTLVHGTVNEIHTWNIIAQAGPSGGSGPEGLTFVPDEWLSYNGFVDQNGNPYTSVNGMGGLMFVAHQSGGYIYVFDLKRSDNTYIFVGKYATGYSESSGLAFDRSIGKLFIWHNTGSNYIEVTQLQSYDIGGGIRRFYSQATFYGPKSGNLEGIAFTPASSGEGWYFATDDSNQDGYAVYWIQSFNPGVFEPFFQANTTTACVGQTITFTDTTAGLGGSESFLWNFGADASPATATGQGPHIVTYLAPGSKNVSLRISGLFTDSLAKASYLTIHPNPVVNLGNDQIICTGDSVLLDAGNSGSTFVWSDGSTSQTIYAGPAGNYSVTVTNTGCTGSDTLNLGNYSLPAVTITPSAGSVCIGSSVTLTAGGASSFVWSTGDITAELTLYPDTTTYYMVAGTDTYGCVNVTGLTIPVYELPEPYITGASSVCSGQPLTLTASGSYIYTWSSGGTGAIETVSPTSDSTFTVTVTDLNNCVNTASHAVTVLQPVFSIQTVNLCYGDTIVVGSNTYTTSGVYTDTLTGMNTCDSIITTNLNVENPVDVTTSLVGSVINANAVASGYQWLDCDNAFAVIVNETGQNFIAPLNGNYAVAVTQNGCTDTSACVNVTTVGAESNGLSDQILLFPNPTDGSFNIQIEKNCQNIEVVITDMPGKEIRRVYFSGTLLTIEKRDMPSGLYLVRIIDEKNNVVTKKLVIR